MALEIPGYYFDATKNRYFKIEATQTAPIASQWTRTAVKRRKAEEESTRRALERADRTRKPVRRHEGLQADRVNGGMLARESEHGYGRGYDDYRGAAWACGVVEAGSTRFARGRAGHMACFHVEGRVGAAYATVDEETVVGKHGIVGGSYLRGADDDDDDSCVGVRQELVRCPQMSSMTYHRGSRQMLLTSRDPEERCGLYVFSPATAPDGRWLVGEADEYARMSLWRPRRRHPQPRLVHSCCAAPPASALLCVAGTEAGLLAVPDDCGATLVGGDAEGWMLGDVLAVDYLAGDPHVVLAGGRRPRVWLADTRAEMAQWASVRTQGSVARLSCVNEHQVVVAGPRHLLALHDLRFLAAGGGNAHAPLVRFGDHANAAHLHTGLAVDAGLAVVAAAQDDGCVGVFALGSGARLSCGGLAGVRGGAPIKALQFETVGGDALPSLFVAEGPVLRRFAYAGDEL